MAKVADDRGDTRAGTRVPPRVTKPVTLAGAVERINVAAIMSNDRRSATDKPYALVLAAVAGISAGLAGTMAACGGDATPAAVPTVVVSTAPASAADGGAAHEKGSCAAAKGDRSSCGGAGGGGKSSCG